MPDGKISRVCKLAELCEYDYPIESDAQIQHKPHKNFNDIITELRKITIHTKQKRLASGQSNPK